MASNETSPATATAHTPTPWYFGHSENPDVYWGEEHWVILSDPEESTGEAIADVETGPGPAVARANAAFIVRACNAHEKLLEALEDVNEALASFYEADRMAAGEHFGAALKDRMDIAIANAKGGTSSVSNHESAA